MSRWTSYLQRASGLISRYTGDTPLAPVLKEYFRDNRQMGSTDRRHVSDLVYGYYRLGHAAPDLPVEERLMLTYFLTRRETSPLLEALKQEWVPLAGLGALEKLEALGAYGGITPLRIIDDIFPWRNHLSKGIEPLALATSHLQQPAFFIRLRPGQEDVVRGALERHGISFELEDTPGALRVPAGAPLQDILPADKAYVVQDLCSQQVRTLLPVALRGAGGAEPLVWDCCAASGGKSILIKDVLPGARLTVSDLRPSILHNLDKRFAVAGIRYERAFAADLTQALPALPEFDLVLADVPCSGSGTWSRTPEQLYFFQEEKIAGYALLQQAILRRVAPAVRPGGYLLLVTCSVFAEENEANVAFLTGEGLVLQTQQVFAGYHRGADTLFGALLQRPG